MQKSKLDQFFSIPAAAVLMAIVCNVLWGSAFPFIKLGYRLFAIILPIPRRFCALRASAS